MAAAASRRSAVRKTPEQLLLEHGTPANVEAERMILGSFQLQGRELIERYGGALSVDSFALEKHRRIFTRMAELQDRGEEVDRVTVANELIKYKELESVDGLAYLTSLDDGMPRLSHIDSYVNIVRQKQALRRLVEVTHNAMSRALLGEEEPAGIAEALESAAAECRIASLGKSGFSTFSEVVLRAGGLQKFLERGIGSAIPYPWEGLNRLMRGGMRPGHLIVIAAASSKGKSAMALNIALNVALNAAVWQKGGAAMFSLEMEDDEICERMLSMESNVNSYRFPWLEGHEREQVRDAARRLTEVPLYINSNRRPSLTIIRSDLKRLVAKQKIAVAVVDYLQLLEGASGGRKGETRAEEVGKFSRGLKLTAGEMRMPIIAVSQLSREHLQQNRKPELRDLRESGSIENDANEALLIHFTEMYDIQAGIPDGECDLIAAKQRGGATGVIRLRFHAPTGTFYEMGAPGTTGKLELVR